MTRTTDKHKPHEKFKISFTHTTVLVVPVSCNNDDDTPPPEPEPTVEELLTTDIWYLESTTRFVADECDKKSNYRFVASGAYFVENFSNDSGECTEIGSASINWELLTGSEIRLYPDDESWEEVWTIESLTADELIVVDILDDTYIFDKDPNN